MIRGLLDTTECGVKSTLRLGSVVGVVGVGGRLDGCRHVARAATAPRAPLEVLCGEVPSR